MAQLTETYRIKFSKEQVNSLRTLKHKYRMNPNWFIRQAIREKIQRDLPVIIKEEEYRNSKEFCPF